MWLSRLTYPLPIRNYSETEYVNWCPPKWKKYKIFAKHYERIVRPRVFHARPNNLSRAFLRRYLRWVTRLSHPPRHILEARREFNFMILSILNIPTESGSRIIRSSDPSQDVGLKRFGSRESKTIRNDKDQGSARPEHEITPPSYSCVIRADCLILKFSFEWVLSFLIDSIQKQILFIYPD
jgi:hypothetical protein